MSAQLERLTDAMLASSEEGVPLTFAKRARELEAALGDGIKRIEPNEAKTAVVQQRALYLTRDVPLGQALQPTDIEALRPAPNGSIKPYLVDQVLGRPTRAFLKKGTLLLHTDLG